MQKRFLFSAVAMALLLGGCGDKPQESKEESVKETVKPTSHEGQSAVVKEAPIEVQAVVDEVIVPVVTEKKVLEVVPVKVTEPLVEEQEAPVVEKENVKSAQGKMLDGKKEAEDKIVLDPAIEVAQSVASSEIAKSVASVDIARAVTAAEATEALVSVETLDLEEDESAHGKANQIQVSKDKAAKTITHVVKEVEAAKAASAATIVSSVQSVEAARAASSVSAPAPASSIEIVKAKSAGEIARSVASVEIAKAKAASDMAKSVAKVEMNKRLYGEESPEVVAIKAKASAEMAEAVGEVKIAQADALADISKSVASVEIAKIEAGVATDSVSRGQRLYLKKMKKTCAMNGADFAKKHTQDVWHTLKEVGYFSEEVAKICPNLKEFKEGWSERIFDFVYEYASDSGHVPSCG